MKQQVHQSAIAAIAVILRGDAGRRYQKAAKQVRNAHDFAAVELAG
ncbi:hypothetical protein GCM10011335_35560 [Aureimonas glaciei]|uniref:Uncharacterized protein n=1 Tax=Aureimonas glaciei TaxID=1776957 RepID=A0A916Y3I9_9HYPH|nr:hypothetical protein GCM10011335_35560 [Aureimonas glaciei]